MRNLVILHFLGATIVFIILNSARVFWTIKSKFFKTLLLEKIIWSWREMYYTLKVDSKILYEISLTQDNFKALFPCHLVGFKRDCCNFVSDVCDIILMGDHSRTNQESQKLKSPVNDRVTHCWCKFFRFIRPSLNLNENNWIISCHMIMY